MVIISEVRDPQQGGRPLTEEQSDDEGSFVTEEDDLSDRSDADFTFQQANGRSLEKKQARFAQDDLLDDGDEDDVDSIVPWSKEDETLGDRIYALKGIVPPETRKSIMSTWTKTTGIAFTGGRWAGNALWIITTSAVLVGLPLALSIEAESMYVQQEKEYQLMQQGGSQLLAPGTTYGAPAAGQPAAAKGLVPPGF
ncbi:uncharacterized protein L969DRAFT_86623 [Mixia osmundae IAM 14324]|uniref:Mitochondrial import receptor subunit tom22 n=1 Tax=Mixia osmundae (strain CBS 9802 / IAM 14324 / JCM 22182 / KY 12970) TaxID=764103 RepID=G7E9R9_MIXOS|nr:uncharacterized protein L969DRAFT_86623 [Mixia osmundae IAM 14324]KEI40020.1 hypothetical protein L969DRAFT_86623 [Mixia osmundae IAM 14324]GAA99388.1 hypothetical protein E5Q_06085 [Mixia osmundae IAM 14324]